MFVALRIEHAMRMSRVVLSCVFCSAVQYYFTLSPKRHDFAVKALHLTMRALIVSLGLLSEMYFSFSEVLKDIS